MGVLSIPLAASGGAAPVTLVEIKTGYIPPPPPPPGPTLPPPFAIPGGQAVAWAMPQAVISSGVLAGCGGIFCPSTGAATGTAATSTANATGAVGYTQSRSLGNNIALVKWSGFAIALGTIPAGAVIQGIYPVIVASYVQDYLQPFINYGDASISNGGFTSPFAPAGAFASTEFYGPSIGTSLALLSAAWIQALLDTTLDLNSMDDLITVTGVGFAIYYTIPGPSTGIGLGDAEAALSVGTYFWSEHRATWPSLITGQEELFLDWLTDAQVFRFYGSTQTDTATIMVQNVSGNTMQRDIAKIFSNTLLIGALCAARIWRGDGEDALLTFIGNITQVDVDDAQMVLTVEGFGNYSAVLAPAYNIDKSCPLTFGSIACGSTSPTPCDQSYGGCLSLNRFAGVVTQWDSECPNVQIAQPAPAVFRNPARAF